MTIDVGFTWNIWGLALAVGFGKQAGFLIMLGPLQIAAERKSK